MQKPFHCVPGSSLELIYRENKDFVIYVLVPPACYVIGPKVDMVTTLAMAAQYLYDEVPDLSVVLNDEERPKLVDYKITITTGINKVEGDFKSKSKSLHLEDTSLSALLDKFSKLAICPYVQPGYQSSSDDFNQS